MPISKKDSRNEIAINKNLDGNQSERESHFNNINDDDDDITPGVTAMSIEGIFFKGLRKSV